MKDGTQPTRVLIVEDSPTQARILRQILTSHGFDVEVASDGPAGYEKFCNSHFDVVVSDVIMPGISGYELCKRIKQKSNGSNTPVVLVTALNELKDLIDGLRSGADNFISKPVNPEFLITRLKAIIMDREHPAERLCDPKTGVCFLEPAFIKSLDRKKILDYLVSTFDDFLRLRETQSQKKLAEAQRYYRLVQQQEIRTHKISFELMDMLSEQERAMNALLNKHQAQLDKTSRESISQMIRKNQLIAHKVAEISSMFKELEALTSEH